ncbi:hypothetical protein NEDG_00537 [Nematocida displodere]|uniref:Uncharacterized protein n=1 Tax=Nematocida displodere TaxID=1805483 RepID=A0A177EBS4_9MICR|nr:hypothetical protein NEDG_00537 [Nematocida displodere]
MRDWGVKAKQSSKKLRNSAPKPSFFRRPIFIVSLLITIVALLCASFFPRAFDGVSSKLTSIPCIKRMMGCVCCQKVKLGGQKALASLKKACCSICQPLCALINQVPYSKEVLAKVALVRAKVVQYIERLYALAQEIVACGSGTVNKVVNKVNTARQSR